MGVALKKAGGGGGGGGGEGGGGGGQETQRESEGVQTSSKTWEDKTGHWIEAPELKVLQKPSLTPSEQR